MADQKIPTLQPSQDVTESNFNSIPRPLWTGDDLKLIGPYYADGGYTNHEIESDGALPPQSLNVNMYVNDENSGIIVSTKSGMTHNSNIEMTGNCRWMPASVFNGVGFRVKQDTTELHALYLRNYSIFLANKTLTNYYRYTIHVVNNPVAGNYLYITDSTAINDIRALGNDWLVSGLCFQVYTNGGITGADNSSIKIYDVKFGHRYSLTGGNYRVIPSPRRSYADRNKNILGFTDPFVL